MNLLDHLPDAPAWILIAAFALILAQEAVNGFHDTANAIATVIYSRSLKPLQAVGLAALFNFLGVLIGGTAVAFTLVYMLPKEMVAGIQTMHEASLLLALIFTAVVWNLGTWWMGIPNSTTHTYVGAIIGIAMAHAFLAGEPMVEQVNWHKARGIVLALIVSPIVGLLFAVVYLKLLRAFVRDERMYRAAEDGERPPGWIRGVLIGGSAGVSLLHGSNDGQKSIGLLMLVLFGLAPAIYGLNPGRLDEKHFVEAIGVVDEVDQVAKTFESHPVLGPSANDLSTEIERLKPLIERDHQSADLTEANRIEVREMVLDINYQVSKLLRDAAALGDLTVEQRNQLEDAHTQLSQYIEHVPIWVIMLSGMALGIGTAIGYKKIVRTLGEGMGSGTMTPAQGTAAQLAAMTGIGLGDFGGMPVSTTHVLSSGVAGTVLATPGEKLNAKTLRSMLIAWVTTLPGTITASFVMGIFFNRMLT